MRNEKISLELFAIISKKYSLVEIDGRGEGKNMAYEKRRALQKGERSLQTGRKVLGNREKGTFWLVAAARPH